MRNIFIVLLITVSLITSGCTVLLVGAAVGLTALAVKKMASNPYDLTEEERKKTEYREIKGNEKDVLCAAKQALKNMGYAVKETSVGQIKNVEQYRQGTNISFGKRDEIATNNRVVKKGKDFSEGLIVGVRHDPFLQITAVVKKTVADHVGLRLIAENEEGIVENKRLYEVLFDKIMEELRET
ncbi:MAG: hypothetical protein PHU64_00325 [Candidatus Omnitrophica bacterium]|nr:hypothetical protein [Candidatus Omnitrophota bacterium]MDD5430288.1 hypothetical protein [Candidatus Omnitrophota bacterium]